VLSVLRSAVPPDTAVGYRVVLWDFRDRTRYLILAYLSRDTAGQYRPALYAIEHGRVSAPYAFKHNERVAVRRIADFDHDALPDVAMCARKPSHLLPVALVRDSEHPTPAASDARRWNATLFGQPHYDA